jgi:hypothetical protein
MASFAFLSLLSAGVVLQPAVSQTDAGSHQARNSGQRLASVDHQGHFNHGKQHAAHSKQHQSLLQPTQPTQHLMRAEPPLQKRKDPEVVDSPVDTQPMQHQMQQDPTPDSKGDSMTEMGESDFSLMPAALRAFILRKESGAQVPTKAPKLSCGAGKVGQCGPCYADGTMENGDPAHPAETRMCLLGKCEKLCDLKDSSPLVNNADCPAHMNLTAAKFTEFQTETCPAASACFPGVAQVQVRGRGRVPISELREHHDHVLVEGSAGEFVYEPVLGWLHHLPDSRASYLAVKHELGELRVSEVHLVFVDAGSSGKSEKLAANLRVGDTLYATAQDKKGIPMATAPMLSKVLSVVRRHGNIGMYAPLTASGTIVVDGALASNYAGPGRGLHVPHNCAHALLFPVRAYHWIASMLAFSSTDARLAETASRFLPSGFFFTKA